MLIIGPAICANFARSNPPPLPGFAAAAPVDAADDDDDDDGGGVGARMRGRPWCAAAGAAA